MNRHRIGVIVLIVLAMSWAVSPSALAAGGTQSRTASLIDGQDICPLGHLTGSTVGTVLFSRLGDGMVVDIQLAGAPANTTFTFDVWANPGCSYLTTIGSFTTDANGNGFASYGAFNVTGSSKFFLYAYSGTRHQAPQAVTKTVSLH